MVSVRSEVTASERDRLRSMPVLGVMGVYIGRSSEFHRFFFFGRSKRVA